ncbi:jg5328 [Pararge aegeria aegeria]|uniref:Jg5328 protein n=1 Tax=Pararge aegeria aegeria TaxID=348720 RepID=A0A8S4RCX6_9NEOP|nr:jg5328 [Pararge aegeria aegeria]
MRGEAGAARSKTAGRSSSNYPPISAAYWLPPSNPTPYHVPGVTNYLPKDLTNYFPDPAKRPSLLSVA